MSITRWEPFSELMPLRDLMNRLMEESFIMPRGLGQQGRQWTTAFPVDIYETEQDVVVKAAMPGMKPDDIDVRITDNVLTIKGEHREDHEQGQRPQEKAVGQQQQGQTKGQTQGQTQGEKGGNYYRREISYGSFYREIMLPTEVQGDKAQATFDNGILTLTLPKAEHAKAKRIQVQSQGGQKGQPRIQGS